MEPAKNPEDIIYDPYVSEFLGLGSNNDFYDSDVEDGVAVSERRREMYFLKIVNVTITTMLYSSVRRSRRQ